MKAQRRTTTMYGVLWLLVALFGSSLAMAQQVMPPTIPPPLRPKPQQPIVIGPPLQAEAEESEAEATPPVERESRLKGGEGSWRQKKVTLAVENAPVAEALTSVAKQAGLGIAIASGEASSKRLTLSVFKQDAADVIDLVLELGDLRAELRGGILYVMNPEPESQVAPQLGAQPARDPGLAGENAQDSESADDDSGHGKHRGWHHDTDIDRAERVLIGKPVRVEAGEVVKGVVSVGGTVTVVGHVQGDAVSVGGSVIVEPTGIVDGEAVAIGGSLEIKPGGKVMGDQVSVGIPFISSTKGEKEDESSSAPMWLLPGVLGAFTVMGILGLLLRAAAILIAALLALFLAPRRVEIVRGYLTSNTGFSFFGGLLMYCLGIPLIIILALTLIGIPLALLVIVALFVCAVLGMASFLVWLGERIPYFRGRSQVWALLVGAGILAAVSAIPVVGCILQVVIVLAASGAALLSRFGNRTESAPPL
ncbi:MAG: hypothetical protein MUC50_04415 [Myxococcota bacterium]|nr:hypothetical protein [Myxococcota bacterium]